MCCSEEQQIGHHKCKTDKMTFSKKKVNKNIMIRQNICTINKTSNLTHDWLDKMITMETAKLKMI